MNRIPQLKGQTNLPWRPYNYTPSDFPSLHQPDTHLFSLSFSPPLSVPSTPAQPAAGFINHTAVLLFAIPGPVAGQRPMAGVESCSVSEPQANRVSRFPWDVPAWSENTAERTGCQTHFYFHFSRCALCLFLTDSRSLSVSLLLSSSRFFLT